METFLIRALQLLLSLSILVLIHEFGHFIFARIFKVRVEKFYLFFDPWFSIFKFKPKNSDTEYGLGWLPLGGYCKISGMIDESMDKEAMAQPAKPYEFRAKPAGQRLLIMVGGVLFNFLLALFIYSMILFKWGDAYLPMENVTMGMMYDETMQEVGFQDGDIPLKADDKKLERLDNDLIMTLVNAKTVTVLRNGVETNIAIPSDLMQQILRDPQFIIDYRYPMIVHDVEANTPAALAGLKPNDSIVSINGIVTPTELDVRKILKEQKNKEVNIGFYRDGLSETVTLQTDTAGNMGIYPKRLTDIYKIERITYSFFGSFPAGAKLGVNTLSGYVSGMKHVFSKEGVKSLGGFGAIGSMFPPKWNWRSFWMQTAFLSIILAFMNILPIPALDGGHVMFLLYEVIARRKPSDKFLEYAQITGMFILFSLLIYANGNDLFRFLFK